MRAKPGAVKIAKLSGFPIVPATFASSNARRLSSWDRFVVPKPFADAVFKVGAPIHVGQKATAGDIEAARRELEAVLNELTAEADKAVGQAPILPDN